MLARCVGWLATCVCLAAAPSIHAESPEEIFNRGNAAYEQRRFEEAAEAYRTLLRYQIEDPRVEYNLGNAEFRLGRLGHAILHFERARRLDPTDSDTLDNLRLARSRCFDRVDEPAQPALLRMLYRLQDGLGPDRQAWIVLGLVWVIGALLAWSWSRPGRWGGAAGWVLAALILVTALVGFSWWATYQRLVGTRHAVVLTEVVEVLAGPGDNNAALVTIHEGLTLEIRAERADWVQVRLPNDINGWIRREALGEV